MVSPKGQAAPATGFRVKSLLVTAAVALCALSSTFSASAAQPKRPPTSLQKGREFYNGKTITIEVTGQPAGSYDLFARALAPYISAYLHATVNVADITAGTTTSAEDIEAGAAPTGLVAGVMQLFTPIASAITNTPSVNFNIAREAWINAEPASPTLIVALSSSPYTSISAIKHATTTPKMLVGLPGSLASALARGLLGVVGAKVQFISGLANTAEEVLGLEQNDGQLAPLTLATAGPLLAGGLVKAVAITQIPPVETAYRQYVTSTPTFIQILKQYPPTAESVKKAAAALAFLTTSPQGLLTLPTAVAGYKVDALRAAAAWAYGQPGFKSQELTDGLSPKLINPLQAKQDYLASLKNDTALSCYILGTC